MWTKSGIESEGQYAVSQEISNTLRGILETDEKHIYERQIIAKQLKINLMKIQDLSIEEIDVVFSIISGGDFSGLQAGTNVRTKHGQLMTIVGFSNKWDQPNKLSAVENTILKELSVRMNLTTPQDKIVGLYYDEQAKERQELISVNLFDVTPVIDIDAENIKKISQMSVLRDSEILKHFIETLMQPLPQNLNAEQKLLLSQINIHILKSLSHMINIGGTEFIEHLKKENLLEKFVTYLYQKQSEQSKSKDMSPVDWVEMRCQQIKRLAMENDLSLIPESNLMTAMVQNNKQIIFNSTDPDTKEGIISNTHLISAINLQNVTGGKNYKCHLQKDITTFIEQPLEKTQLLKKYYSLVFYEGQELIKLDDKALNVLLHSEVVLTTNDIQPKELFTKLVEALKKDDEKEEKERCLTGLLESVVLFVRKPDYERVQQPIKLNIKSQYKEAQNPLEGLVNELSAWANVDKDLIYYHLGDMKNERFNVLAMRIVKILKDKEDEKQKNKDKLKKLEVDKKFKELEALKKKIAEQEAKRQNDIKEKLISLNQGSGADEDVVKLSAIEKIIEQSLKEESQENFDKELELPAFFKDEKKKTKIEETIDKKFVPFNETQDESIKAKSDAALVLEFYDIVKKIDTSQLHFEYIATIAKLQNMYSRRALLNILSHCDLQKLLPILLSDKKSQKKFACFVKTTFHDNIIIKITSGAKDQLKQFKQIMKKIFEFCFAEPEYQIFLKEFLRFDIMESGLKTITNMFQDAKNVKEYFKSEEIVIQELNPYLMVFITQIYMKNGGDYLLEKVKYLPALFEMHMYQIFNLQGDKSGILTKLYQSTLRLLQFIENNLQQTVKIGALDYILNNELLKEITSRIDYDSTESKYDNQQKVLLEIHMKLLDIHTMVIKKEYGQVDTNLENSDGILKVKRGKTVLTEREKFDFLKYYIFFQGLEDYQKELLNQIIETNHYAFNAKILAKFQIKQSEKLKITFNEKTKLKDFTFLGIGSNANGKGLETYNQSEITGSCKEIEEYRGDFYIFYPVKKQIVIAFGEGNDNKLGTGSTSNSGPAAAYCTKELKPKAVYTSWNHSVIIDSDNQLFRTGQIKRSGNQNSDFQKVTGYKGNVKLVSLGKFNMFVVTDDNSIYRQGFSKDGHLGINTDYSNLSKMEKVDDEEQITEPIVDMSSGTHFTLFVTESGKLYGIGNRFLKEIGLDCDNKIIQIPMREGAKVLKAYASMGKQQPLAIIKVQLEDGSEQLWSAGRNEQGLLGQGQLIKVSKSFKPVKYDHLTTKFIDISIHSDHAVAIDQEGKLWAWGSNVSKRSGFKEDIFDGVFEPRKVKFVEDENLTAIKVKCGFDHSLVLFEDETKTRKLYSIGADEVNYHHLGITQLEAEEKNIFYREITTFRGHNILEFDAGKRTSFVIIEGDNEPTDNIYTHTIDGAKQQGILHFYKDKNGEFKYLTQDQYESQKEALPDICYAIKCPIDNITNLDFPNVHELAEQFIDYENYNFDEDYTCAVTQQKIEAERYYSYSKINGDTQTVNLSQKGLFQPNIYDINPLIYYRIKRPLKKNAKLPLIDLKKYYEETAAYGLDMQVTPILEYQQNDQLVEFTKSQFDEIVDNVSKFPPELDMELLKEMDRYVKANLSDKNIADIKVKDDFKINDMQFKNPKFKKLSESVKRRRMELFLNFNQFFINIMPYISLDEKTSGGDMSKNFQSVKNMILFSMKNKFIQNSISALPCGNQGYVEIKRRKAQRFCEQGKVDHKGEHTIFGQIFSQIAKTGNLDCFRQSSTDQKSWSTKFLGEGSIDAGGPFREAMTNMCSELESDNLPLLIKTVNNRNNHGEFRDCFIPNPSSNNPSHLEMFKFLGGLLGYGIRTMCPIPLHFPPIFWKQIMSDQLEIRDLKGIDTYSWQIIEDLKKQSQKLSDEEFNLAVEEKFITRLSDGTEVELCRGGREKVVTKSNLDEYIALLLQKRFEENSNQIKAIKEGINYVIPIEMIKLFTWEEVETRACGDKVLDLEKLKKITEYSCCSADHEAIKRFWSVLESLTDDERTLYLKFVWGRTRLPYETESLRDNHTLYYCSYRGDKDFPEAHTCFFQLDLPNYTTDEICKQRIVTAITLCGEIDADHSADYIPDDNDED